MILTDKQKQRFWNKVDKTNSSKGCWLWTASLTKKGYGCLSLNRKVFTAHRISYIIHYGNIPENKIILHKPLICHNRSCINPSHLYAGTWLDNVLDKKIDGTETKPDNKGSKHGMSKLNENDILSIRKLYQTKLYNHRELGLLFNVNRATISYIVSNKTWKHI